MAVELELLICVSVPGDDPLRQRAEIRSMMVNDNGYLPDEWAEKITKSGLLASLFEKLAAGVARELSRR